MYIAVEIVAVIAFAALRQVTIVVPVARINGMQRGTGIIDKQRGVH
jgi:hypothetical protein